MKVMSGSQSSISNSTQLFIMNYSKLQSKYITSFEVDNIPDFG